MQLKTYILLLLVFFGSCIEKTDWDLKTEDLDYIVVEGIITNKNIQHEIKISRTVQNLNEKAQPVSGAYVAVHDGDTLRRFFEDITQTGIYKPDSAFIGVINKVYTLFIQYNQKSYIAKAIMQPVIHFTPLTYKYNSENGLNEIVHIASSFSSENPAMWKIFINWSYRQK